MRWNSLRWTALIPIWLAVALIAVGQEAPTDGSNAPSAELPPEVPSHDPSITPESSAPDAGGLETTPTALTVSEIIVKGSENVDELLSTLFDQGGYFQTRKNQEISPESLNNDIRRIYTDYGPFKNIETDVEPVDVGLRVTFLLTEYALVEGDIELVGNKNVKFKDIAKKFTMKDGERFSEYQLWKTVQQVEALYREKGYYFAKVTGANEETPEGIRVRLDIDEGEQVKIEEVRFEGNTLATDKELRKAAQVKKGKRFQDEVFRQDDAYILTVYHDLGCLNAKIIEKRREVDDAGTGIIVTYVVEEGPQFVFTGYDVEITDTNAEINEKRVREELSLQPGDVFNATQYTDDLIKVQEIYSNRGNILARVIDDLRPNTTDETVHATVSITEGTTILVGEVRVRGLQKTKEHIILRELERMNIKSGEPLKASNLRKAEQNIIQLGSFIQGLQFVPRSTDDPAVKDLEVELRENTRTGLFTIGGGYGSESGLFGVAEIGDGNFTGRAYRVNVRGELGQRARRVGQVTFGTPWIFDTPTSLNATIYSINRRRYIYGYEGAVTADDSYEDFRKGGSITLGTPITRDIRAFLTFRDEFVSATSIPLIDQQQTSDEFLIGSRETRSFTIGASRDTRHYRTSLFDPIGGGESRLSFEHSGGFIGGRNAFRKYTLEN
ncbi:MAG: BamA/TamA family outer membrane protein, partial [Candidatus Poribacteria bacterium]|nr:BamA/TamA family outer membrane protein [Candidatus Poribacteria bacterium]